MLEFWLCCVPLFVVMDAVGVLPTFLSLTRGMGRHKVHRAIYRSVATAAVVANEKLQRQVDSDNLGVVPLGVPLITGPAVLTTSMLLLNLYGAGWTAAAIVANILIVGTIFFFAGTISRALGQVGEKIISKIAMLLLAAIGVVMVRKGVEAFIAAGVAGAS